MFCCFVVWLVVWLFGCCFVVWLLFCCLVVVLLFGWVFCCLDYSLVPTKQLNNQTTKQLFSLRRRHIAYEGD